MIRLLPALLLATTANAQDVYISTHGQPVPTEQRVIDSISLWNAALGIDLRFAGYTQLPCIDGAITYRTPSIPEWQAATGGYVYTVAAAVFACQPELNYSGAVVLNSPIWADPSFGIYAHELGHAIGGRHVSEPGALMYSGTVTATEVSPVDVRAVIDCTPWLGTDGVLRVPSLTYNGGPYRVELSQVGGGLWYVTKREEATPRCIWNFRLPNGELALWEVVAGGMRYDVRMVPSGNFWRIGTVRPL